MLCTDLMKSDITCVSPDETVQIAAKRMLDDNVGFLPVCDSEKKALGTLTDRDLAIRVLAQGQGPDTRVEGIYSREIVACRPDEDLRRAEALMAQQHKSRVMCLDDQGRVVGVISLSDVATREESGKVARTLKRISEREASV